MSRNIELKANYPDHDAAQRIARALGAELTGREEQRDTYFRVPSGRLKLRERRLLGDPAAHAGRPVLASQLIWYERTDEARPRASDYALVPVQDGDALRALLTAALGAAGEVFKARAIYLHDSVRIHLDEVTGLGRFIEFEAIVRDRSDDAAAHHKVERLRGAFGIAPHDIRTGSYADLLRDCRGGRDR